MNQNQQPTLGPVISMLELTPTKLQDQLSLYILFFYPLFCGIRLVHYKSDDYTNSITRACFMFLKYSLLDLCSCNHKDKVANGAVRGCSKYKRYIYPFCFFFWGGWGLRGLYSNFIRKQGGAFFLQASLTGGREELLQHKDNLQWAANLGKA